MGVAFFILIPKRLIIETWARLIPTENNRPSQNKSKRNLTEKEIPQASRLITVFLTCFR